MRFHVLDGWRGVSALLVVLFHIPVLTSISVSPFVRNSFLFVDFFFVLSGFVITYAYDERVTERAGLAGFVVRRFGRLWPLHVFMLGCMIALELLKLLLTGSYGSGSQAPFTGRESIPLILSNLTLLQAARPEPLLSWNTPSWSISAEFWAYLLFALVRNAFGKYSTAVAALIALASCGIILGFSTRAMDVVAWLGFFRCLFGFFTGHLLFRFYRSAPLTRWPAFRSLRNVTLLEIGGVLAVILFVSGAGRTETAVLAPLLFAAVIYVFASEAGMISRLLRTRAFDILGRLSYSVYMIHAVLFLATIGLVHFIEKRGGLHLTAGSPEGGDYIDSNPLISFGGEWLMLFLTILLVAGVVAMSALTYRFIELPGRWVFGRWAALIESRGPDREGARNPIGLSGSRGGDARPSFGPDLPA